MRDLPPEYPIPIKRLKHACRDWLGGLRPPVAFELERLGLLRLTRIAGQVYVAADDAQGLIELCRQKHERPGLPPGRTEGAQ